MKYRTLGSTNLRVSVVGLGTWQYGGEWGVDYAQADVDAIFAVAREEGINLIDTAECYGDHTSERFIGQAIKADRDKWIVATKFGHKFHSHLNRSDTRTPQTAMAELEASLAALQTSVIDLWQYHSWGDDTFFNDDVLAVVHKAKDQGKVRFIGNSVGSNGNVKQIAASGKMSVEAIQIIYNRLDRKPEEQVFAECIKQNLGVLARVPLASGYLSGKYKPGAVFDKTDVRANHNRQDVDAKLAEVQTIARDEVPVGVSMAQWALAWCLQHPAVTCVIPGCKDARQVRDNAAAAELNLVSDAHPQAAE